MQIQVINLVFILTGVALAAIARVWLPTVPELGMVGTFLIGLGIKRFGDVNPPTPPTPPPSGGAASCNL